MSKIIFFAVLLHLTVGAYAVKAQASSHDSLPRSLPGTQPLTWELTPDEVSKEMLEGAHRFIEEKIGESKRLRAAAWKRDFRSAAAYDASVEPNRKRLMHIIGVAGKDTPLQNYNTGIPDEHPKVEMEKISVNDDPALIAETASYRIYQVRWPVLPHVYGEGLLLQPKSKSVANVVAIPDADQTPEQLTGLSPGVDKHSQFARHLAENGFQVLIPVLVSRTTLAGRENSKQTFREWIYRQAFHMGKHLIGYEVQKVMAAIDWFGQSGNGGVKTGVVGYNEGGLIALYSAAIDKRIDAAMVSGYFNARESVWEEPIYRNVWNLLSEFGDAEIASLIAPRALVIEHSALPETLVQATAKPKDLNEYTYTGYKGSLVSPDFNDVSAEFDRIAQLTRKGWGERHLVHGGKDRPVPFGSAEALEKFSSALGVKTKFTFTDIIPGDQRQSFDPEERQKRQVRQIEAHVQAIMRDSDYERNRFFLYKVMPEFTNKRWSTKSYHPYFDPEPFIRRSREYRDYFHKEVLGKFEDKLLSPNARSRKIYDEKLWEGYEVVLDVYKDLIAPGVLLLPKDMKPGEKRPVVVCQHGRNGVPQTLVEGNTSYYNMAAKLADRGFIVYAPYGLFKGEDRYRWLDRKANSVGKTLFSFIVSQHDQLLKWLGTLPFVDKDRIAFYGKSYGGETAMRVPSVLEGYALSVCSADFGDWTRKVVDTHYYNSFMGTIEWEMPYFNMGSTFSYAEMAYLIFPRPFMVERGRHDLVQPDEWVAYEYGKVSHLYDQFNMEDKTQIEFFNGGHASRNDGVFHFLHKHLNWP